MFVARSASEILDEIREVKKLSSDKALGEIFGVPQATVANWRARESLPDRIYKEIIEFCIREGISTDSLLMGERKAMLEYEPVRAVPHPIYFDDLFTTRLKMELRGRSIEWLATESGIDLARIEEIVSGRELPIEGELKNIARVLGVRDRWLAERSPFPSENWDYEFYKKDDDTMLSLKIFKAYLLATEDYIKRMGGLVNLSSELKAEVITIACRVHMKETPYSLVVNPELIKSLERLAKLAGPDKIPIWGER